MVQRRITLIMPSCASDAFEAFHNHSVRKHWDTLLSHAAVEGGGNHPYIGAITLNKGRGWKRLFAKHTRFVHYRPGQVAAAVLVANHAAPGSSICANSSVKHRAASHVVLTLFAHRTMGTAQPSYPASLLKA